MILVVTTNRQFLIYGDQGIHEKVGQDYWEEIEKSITMKFKENKMGDGLSTGIHLIGTKPAQYIAKQSTDITCPKCGHTQRDSNECMKCGIIFSKYNEAATPKQMPRARTAEPEKSVPPGSIREKLLGFIDKSMEVLWA